MNNRQSTNRYLEIYEYIRERIQNGNFLPGEKIPSENQLKNIFEVSRNTVRRAIDMLASEGLLSSVHGKGVFVLERTPLTFQMGGVQSFKEVSDRNNLNYSTTIPIFEILTVDEQLHKKTGLPISSEVYHIVRVREIEKERVILDNNYFLKDTTEGLTAAIAMDSIYSFLENEKNLKINGAQKIISVEPADGLDEKYLNLDGNTLVVIVKNFAFLDNGTQFEYTESHHRPDRFSFSSYAKR